MVLEILLFTQLLKTRINVCNVCKKVQSLDSVLLWGYNKEYLY